MTRVGINDLLLALIFALTAALGMSPAAAAETRAPCIVSGVLVDASGQTPKVNAAANTEQNWNCKPLTNEPAGGDWTLRFDIAEGETAPKVLYTRLGHFDQLDLAVQDVNGRWTYETKTLADMHSVIGSPYIYTDLPGSAAPPRQVLAAFTGNGHGPTLTRAKLIEEAPGLSEGDVAALLALAALIGVLLIPIALDGAFLMVLRQSFLAWHIALSVVFAIMIATRANLFGLLMPMSAEVLRIGLIMSMGLGVAVALMFTRSFIEPGKISAKLHRIIPYAAVWTVAVSIIHAASLDVLRPLGGNFHSFSMAVPVIVLVMALVDAWRRGSRSVKFQVFGWAPMFLATFIQIVTHVFPLGVQQDALPIFYIGILSEGIGTALGVADRFLQIRRERDRALRDARELTHLSEHDPLTGLLNRRAVETRFDDLREQGFDTFALLDLDRFKLVNDRFGHQAGDAALTACADAIRGGENRDSIAVRLGGEEFVILLRGKNTRQRAEAFREAIPVRIMHQVEGLDMPVTASMGLIELPRHDTTMMTFDDMYARADMLLYEAKAAGRNRMNYERLTLFAGSPKRSAEKTAA